MINCKAVAALALFASLYDDLALHTPPGGSGGGFMVLAAAAVESDPNLNPRANNPRRPNRHHHANMFQTPGKEDKVINDDKPNKKMTDDKPNKKTPTAPHMGCAKFLQTNHEPQKLKPVNYRGKKEKESSNHQVDVSGLVAVDSSSATAAAAAANERVRCTNGFAGSYPCSNIDLMSFIPLDEFATAEEVVEGNDIWGWTHATTGREFALMGLTSGTAFVEITDPINPKYVGFLFTYTVCSNWRDIKTYANHAFIVSEASGHGMQVLDLTQLLSVEDDAMPVQFGESAHYGGFSNAHNIVINEESGFAYAVGTNRNNGGLHIVDIRDPKDPKLAGGFSSDGYTHDAQCVIYNGPDSGYTGREICFNYNEDTLTIVDVTNKSSPTRLGKRTYSGAAYTHQGWLTDDGKHVVVNDEVDENNFDLTRTHVFNVENLNSPVYVGYHKGTTNARDHNLYIKDNLVFEANYRAGLQVLEIVDLAQAKLNQVAHFDIYPSSNSDSYNGAWSNYPFFPSGSVIVSGIEQGLYVLQSSNNFGVESSTNNNVRKRKLDTNRILQEEPTVADIRRSLQDVSCSTIQDFELVTTGLDGWSTAGSTCTRGTFEVGTPTQVIEACVMTQLGGDHTTGSGKALYSASNNDVRGECMATSPVYSVTENSILSAWYFHGQRDTGDDAGDYFRLEKSVDGGDWSALVSIGDVSTRATWTKVTTNVDGGSNIRLRVRASDGSAAGDTVEAGIDDIVICPTGTASPTTSSVPSKEPTPNPTTAEPTPTPPPTPCPGMEITVDILTDNWPLETSWKLINTCGTTDQTEALVEAGDLDVKGEQYSDTYCLPSAEYRFEISDTYGDGICCDYGIGNYEVFLDGELEVSGAVFAFLERSETFGSCDPLPTNSPSPAPTNLPTTSPTSEPSDAPSTHPTKLPTDSPIPAPTNLPTTSPTHAPSNAPSTQPTKLPTDSPIPAPTNLPTTSPTHEPTNAPSTQPTKLPTESPIPAPTNVPTVPEPTKNPTSSPSNSPSNQPTPSPTKFPTTSPTKNPTSQPTTLPPTPIQVVATFDSSLRVPKCSDVGSSCTSGTELLNGSGANREPNPSNTLDSCTDGSRGAYHDDESIDMITVSTVEGGPLQAEAMVVIEAKVWAWQDGSADTADFYYAADANDPDWQHIRSRGAGGFNLRTLKVEYELPVGALQAVRVNYRYSGSQSSCAGGRWDDVDDLVFSVAAGSAAVAVAAASIKKPLPVPPAEPMPSSHCATIDRMHKDRCVENSGCKWKNGRGKGCYPKK